MAPGAEPVAEDVDPGDVRGQARAAQARYERLRSRLFPRRFGGGRRPCDEIVGRFCSWYGEGEWFPEPEDPGIAPLRASLLDELDSLQTLVPGDPWTLGQRVWYRSEGGDHEGALELARACGPPQEGWWCAALAGFALHRLERYEESGRAFAEALYEMDVERAWRWRVPVRAVESEARSVLTDLRFASVDSVQHVLGRLWALADPLFLVPGNDRRTEHLARWTVATLREDSRTPYGIRWGSDIEELLVRNGWEIGWEVERDPRFPGEESVIGRKHPEGRDYLPDGVTLLAPEEAGPEAHVADRARPRSLYAPVYAPVILPMGAQVARFPRGPEMHVVVTHFLPDDTTFHADHDHPRPWMEPDEQADLPDRAGLFVLDARSGRIVARAEAGTIEGARVVTVPEGAFVLSAEAWSPSRRRAGRMRTGFRHVPVPEDVPTLSDLLLVRPGADPPPGPDARTREPELADVVERALPSVAIPEGSRLGVAWEVSGLGFRDESLDLELSVERLDRGVFQRIGGLLGLSDPERPLALAWREGGPEVPGPMLRVVDLELPELEPGRYRITLVLRTAGREPVTTTLDFRVREGGG